MKRLTICIDIDETKCDPYELGRTLVDDIYNKDPIRKNAITNYDWCVDTIYEEVTNEE